MERKKISLEDSYWMPGWFPIGGCDVQCESEARSLLKNAERWTRD